MGPTETIADFYRIKFNQQPVELHKEAAHMNVFRLEDCIGQGALPIQYSRRDYYKVSLIRGDNLYHYADKSIRVNGSTLLFFNPQVPYNWEPLSDNQTGYFCIFRDAFIAERMRGNLQELPMFRIGGKPAYPLEKAQDELISGLFEKMLAEVNTDYIYKYDLIHSYLSELIHTALKFEPSDRLYQHPDAKSRTTAAFIELLERQFPIELPGQRFRLRSARDFAQQLSVHINHLNRSIRDTTGRTTTAHIAERLVREATALLKHTDWNIAEISYCLGFDEPAHFTYFFKKHTRLTPSAYRTV
jgi:AraC family transcriptional activator of pobA